jgi:hypothetical protein
MASTIDFGALTLNSEEARAASEAIFEKSFVAPEISNVHGIVTGITMDRYIPIFGQYGLVGKINPGSCSVNTGITAIPTSQKQWTPKLISDRIVHCQDDVDDLLKIWKNKQKALGTWEDIDNEMLAFIQDSAVNAIKQMILRFTSLGDTSEDTVANGGNLTNGTTKAYFTALNGLWQQIIADQAGAALSYRHTITENSGVTYAAQNALAADAAYNALVAMYENVDDRAFEGTPVFQLTKGLYHNLLSFYETKSFEFTLDRVENAAPQLSFRGIPVIVRKDWSRFIQAYFDNAVTLYLPHRAILTDINNIPIGTSDTESLTSFDSFYDKKDKTWNIDIAVKIDQKNLLEYELACAY